MSKQYISLGHRWNLHHGENTDSGEIDTGGVVDTNADNTNIGDDEGGYGTGAGEGEGEGEDDDGHFSDQPRGVSSVIRMKEKAESYTPRPMSFGTVREQQRTSGGTTSNRRGRSNSGKSSSRALNNASIINQVMRPKRLSAGRPLSNTFPIDINPNPNGPSIMEREHAQLLGEGQSGGYGQEDQGTLQGQGQGFGQNLDFATTGMEDMSLNSTSHHDYPGGWGTGITGHLLPRGYDVPSIQVQSGQYQATIAPQPENEDTGRSTRPSGFYHNVSIQRYYWDRGTQTMTPLGGPLFPWVVENDAENVKNVLISDGYVSQAHGNYTNTTG